MNCRILSRIQSAEFKKSVDSVPNPQIHVTGSNLQLSNEEEVELEEILLNDESMNEDEGFEDEDE